MTQSRFIDPFSPIPFTATADVVAGEVVTYGTFGAVVTDAALVGEQAALRIAGVFEIDKVSAQAWTPGDEIFWDDTAKKATNVSADFRLGLAVRAAGTGTARGRVSLNAVTSAGGGGGAVTSVFTRTGAVAAQANDYTWAQINKTTSSIADITTREITDVLATAATDGHVPTVSSGALVLQAPASAPVASVFTRTGAVTAQTNDYTWAQINKTTSSIADITTREITDVLATAATDGHVPTVSSGALVLQAPASAPVASVFTRTGAVTAQTNDYTWAQINKTTSSIADITTREITDVLATAATDGHVPTVSSGALVLQAPLDALPRTAETNLQGGAYSLVSGDNGKFVEVNGTLTIPNGLPVGFQCTVGNVNASNQTITLGGSVTTVGKNFTTTFSGLGLITLLVKATNTIWITGDME